MPQSNQGGIESGATVELLDGRLIGRNRTKVGLKVSWAIRSWVSLSRPQSNQGGIESGLYLKGDKESIKPQSNQGGIERAVELVGGPHPHNGRNRTKVGLKAGATRGCDIRWPCRNRTKVGLKADVAAVGRQGRRRRNRTKVGLKGLANTPAYAS